MSPRRDAPSGCAPGDSTEVAAYLAEIDRQRKRLYRMLRGVDWRSLNRRPPSGAWSPLENARHLLFAEQLHLGDCLPGKLEFSAMGVTGMRAKRFTDVGKARPRDLEEVLKAWDAIHRPIRLAVRKSERVDLRRLWGNGAHARIHTDIVERLLG